MGNRLDFMSAFNQRIQPIRDLMKAKGLEAFVLRRKFRELGDTVAVKKNRLFMIKQAGT